MAITTDIGTTTPDAIQVRGLDLSADILGKFDFVDMICWLAWGRRPEPREKDMLNLLLVTAADHGLTPSAISARMTYLGAPESLQGAVAAGLLGAGSHFLGTVQNAAEFWSRHAADLADDASDEIILARARALVLQALERSEPIPGVGHPIHVDGDPRVPVLRAVSERNRYFGRHWRLALAVEHVLRKEVGKPLPLNAAGANGAVMADMRLDPLFGRGLALIGRAAGLVAHVIEERAAPIGQAIWDLLLDQDARNVRRRAEEASSAT